MRSGELARLAGVSVRTLRHYHQIGLLPEPDRSSNGYREYTVHDLIGVLRVRRLAELGVSLDEIAKAQTSPDTGEAILDRLDAELEAQITHLTARREIIATMRREGAPLDLPPQFARLTQAFIFDRESETLDMERALLLISLLGGVDESNRWLTVWDDHQPEVDPADVRDMQHQFAHLTAHADEAERASLTETYLSHYHAVLEALLHGGHLDLPAHALQLIAEYTVDTLNAAQLDVLSRIGRHLTFTDV